MKQILLTNDDGIQAPGLKSLEESLASVGEVTVVAPDKEMSGTSQSISVHTPLRVRQLDERHYAVSGTPADTVIIASTTSFRRSPIWWFPASTRAATWGKTWFTRGPWRQPWRPRCTVCRRSQYPWPRASTWIFPAPPAFAAQLAAKVLEEGLPEGVMLNVNVPRGEVRGVRLTRQSQKISQNLVLEKKDPRGRPYYWLDETVELDRG